MNQSDLVRLSAAELAARLRRRELTARKVVEAHLERIDHRDPQIRAWTIVDAEGALERARVLDRRVVSGPLHGLPIGVKDIIDTAALGTEYGSPIYRGHRPAADAACVAAARNAGAIVLGKTVTTEFANFSPGPTVNPANPGHTPGGSSSGSAAAVADGMVPLAFGTQTLGSVIRPASFCGIVGYKPSFGVIPTKGVRPVAASLDTVGLFARSVRDAALFAGAVAGRPDLTDPPPAPAPPRIGMCRTHEWHEARDEVRTAMEEAARALAEAGADIQDIELPEEFAALRAASEAIFGRELALSLAHERRRHPGELTAGLRDLIDAGGRIDAGRYEHALQAAVACRGAFPAAMNECHVLLTPSTPGEAPAGLGSTGSPVMNRLWTVLHVPAVNVPAFQGPAGLPVGLQVIGRFGDDARTLAAAEWIHARLTTNV